MLRSLSFIDIEPGNAFDLRFILVADDDSMIILSSPHVPSTLIVSKLLGKSIVCTADFSATLDLNVAVSCCASESELNLTDALSINLTSNFPSEFATSEYSSNEVNVMSDVFVNSIEDDTVSDQSLLGISELFTVIEAHSTDENLLKNAYDISLSMLLTISFVFSDGSHCNLSSSISSEYKLTSVSVVSTMTVTLEAKIL